MKKNIAVAVVLIAIFLAGGAVYIAKEHAQTSAYPTNDPHADPTNGWYIPFTYSGTFKNAKTGEVFSYSGKDDNVLSQCLDQNCRSVCFFADWSGAMSGTSFENCADQEHAIRGKVTAVNIASSAPSSKKAAYTIAYQYNGTAQHYADIQELCFGVKGGGVSCNDPMEAGQPVNVFVSADGKVSRVSYENYVRAAVLSLSVKK